MGGGRGEGRVCSELGLGACRVSGVTVGHGVPSLPAVVPVSSFTSCNLSFAILKMGIMQMVPHE